MDLSGGGADLLPPSPSALSPVGRPFAHHFGGLGASASLDYIHSASSAVVAAAQDTLPTSASAPLPETSSLSLAAPPIRPLDFSAFVTSSEETHVELARTVDDLSKWLAVVEGGLAALLERTAGAGVIEEEMEAEEGLAVEGA